MAGTIIKVVIAEDHALLRLGLKVLLELHNVVVVAEAENGEQAVVAVATAKPDVVLMDLGMPRMDGIEAARRIREFDQNVKIIMLTSLDNDEHIHASFAAGVNGYCLKETRPDQLLMALETVRDGGVWIDSSIAAKILRNLPPLRADSAKDSSGEANEAKQLSREELAVLHMIIEGLGVQEIAVQLGKSEECTTDIKLAIMQKLASSERTKSALRKLRSDSDPFMAKATRHCTNCGRKFEDDFKCCPFDGSCLDSHVTDTLTGTVFADRFEIISKLGKGGMSVVYKAKHKLLGRVVAIKLLDPLLTADLQNARRFRDEALASSLLQHPNLINISDFGLTPNGEPYLIMDYLSGKTLADILHEDKYIGTDRAISIFIQICDGLAYAHKKGIIHRDMKPSNVMLVADEHTGNETVKIIDFGIAKVLASSVHSQLLTQQGEILGSPCYMSPEQCLGQTVDERSDVYSLGCAMYQVLSGKLPLLGAEALITMQKHISEIPVSLHEATPEVAISAYLSDIVMKALRKEPSDRYQSMDELKVDLSQLRVAS